MPPGAEIWPAQRVRRWRILLVDDHAVVRDGLAGLLRLEPDMEIVGAAGDIRRALELLPEVKPDMIICDLNLPDVSGGQAIRSLRLRAPGVTLLVLTAHDSLEYVRAAFINGAIGYVCKDAPRSDLLKAVRRAANGRHAVCGTVWDAVIVDWLEHYQPPVRRTTLVADTDDAKVIRMVALGVPSRRIAELLGRSIKATEKYRTTLMRRLGLRSAAAVTRYAVESGLVNSRELDQVLEESVP